MAKYQQGFPVNENGEVVTANGSGTRTIVGTLPTDQLPVNSNGEFVLAPQTMRSQIIASNYNPVVRTSVGDSTDTNYVTLATIPVPGNSMGANGYLLVSALMTSTVTGTKTLAIDFGGQNVGAPGLTGSQVTLGCLIRINNAGSVSSQKTFNGVNPYSGASNNSIVTTTINTAVGSNIVLKVKWAAPAGAAGADNITLIGYTVEAVYAP